MSIQRILADSDCPPDHHPVLESAFSRALALLGLVDRNDPICDLVAGKTVEVWRRGETDDKVIAEAVYKEIGL